MSTTLAVTPRKSVPEYLCMKCKVKYIIMSIIHTMRWLKMQKKYVSLPNEHQSSGPQNFYDLQQVTMECNTSLFQLEMICIHSSFPWFQRKQAYRWLKAIGDETFNHNDHKLPNRLRCAVMYITNKKKVCDSLYFQLRNNYLHAA